MSQTLSQPGQMLPPDPVCIQLCTLEGIQCRPGKELCGQGHCSSKFFRPQIQIRLLRLYPLRGLALQTDLQSMYLLLPVPPFRLKRFCIQCVVEFQPATGQGLMSLMIYTTGLLSPLL